MNKEILNRLNEFSKIKEKEEIFYELCFCLLTPQSNAFRCWDAVLELKNKNFFKKDFDLKLILIKKTRFHNNKSNNLKLMKNNFDEIYKNIKNLDKIELRRYLFENIKGIGLKEASHFMRNIGFRGLAILDRHILKNLVKLNIIDEIPFNLNKRKYFEIEEKFKRYCNENNLDMDELDLYFWSLENGKVFK